MLWVMLVLAASGPSPENSDLQEARRAYDTAAYRRVLPAVQRALKSPLSPAERAQAFQLQALTYAAFDDAGMAVESFRRALGASPRYQLDEGMSPKVRELFEKARRLGPLPRPAVLEPALPPASALAVPSPVAADAPKAQPLWHRPWLWVATGAVLAGGAAGFLYAHRQQVPAGSLGRGVLQ